jgi:hypothetical protein
MRHQGLCEALPFPLLALMALYWLRLGRYRRWRRHRALGVNIALRFLEIDPRLVRSRGLHGFVLGSAFLHR